MCGEGDVTAPNGHAFDQANTHLRPASADGRMCRTCQRLRRARLDAPEP